LNNKTAKRAVADIMGGEKGSGGRLFALLFKCGYKCPAKVYVQESVSLAFLA